MLPYFTSRLIVSKRRHAPQPAYCQQTPLRFASRLIVSKRRYAPQPAYHNKCPCPISLYRTGTLQSQIKLCIFLKKFLVYHTYFLKPQTRFRDISKSAPVIPYDLNKVLKIPLPREAPTLPPIFFPKLPPRDLPMLFPNSRPIVQIGRAHV